MSEVGEDERTGPGGRSDSTRIAAGPIAIDVAEHRALLDGRDLQLSPLLMNLLIAILGGGGRLVTRTELNRALWPGSERIDTEQRLNTAMKALRAALGDEAESARFIETVRGKGYRWVGPAPRKAGPLRSLGVAIAGACALALILAGAWALLQSDETSPPSGNAVALLQAQAAVDDWRVSPGPQTLALAERAVDTARRTSGTSPAANVLEADLAMEAHWDWPKADAAFARALTIDPTNPDARLGRAWLRVNRGDTDGAIADANQLLLESRLSGERRVELGWLFIRAGRPDLARAACPPSATSLNGLSCAHTAFAATGDLATAKSAALKLMRAKSAAPSAIAGVESVNGDEAYRRFLVWRARNFLPPSSNAFDRAQVLADAGYGEEAIALLERSVAAHEPKAAKIYSSPSFVRLRTQPRYQALVRKVGIDIGPDARTRG